MLGLTEVPCPCSDVHPACSLTHMFVWCMQGKQKVGVDMHATQPVNGAGHPRKRAHTGFGFDSPGFESFYAEEVRRTETLVVAVKTA